MSVPFFITESWLAENAVLTAGGEVRLPANSRLTPAARDALRRGDAQDVPIGQTPGNIDRRALRGIRIADGLAAAAGQ